MCARTPLAAVMSHFSSAPVLSQVLSALVPDPMMGVPDRIASTPAHEPPPRYTTVVGGVCAAMILPISASNGLAAVEPVANTGVGNAAHSAAAAARAPNATSNPANSVVGQRAVMVRPGADAIRRQAR